VVHRDVKPSNVILDAFDHPHLTDFGISRLLDATTRTATGTLIGTAAYLSPEQVLGQPVGRPADVYALGLVLLECLTGRLEYDGGPLEAAIARLHRQPGLPGFLPAELAALLRDMTALDEQARPTARDCVLTLAALSADTGPTPHRPAARATGIAARRRPTGDSTSTHRTPLSLPERPVSEAVSRAVSTPARPRSRVLMAGATAALAAAMAATLAVADGPSHQNAENKPTRPATGPAVTSPSPGTSEDGNDTPAPQPSVSRTVSAPAQSVSPAPGNPRGLSVTDGAPTPDTTAPRQGTTDATGRLETKTTSKLSDQGKKKASAGQGDEQNAGKATKIRKK
jgi:serine/threonine protein kinase